MASAALRFFISLSASAFMLAGACSRSASTEANAGEHANSAQGIRTHSESDGFELSPTGASAAIALIREPADQLLVVDFTSNSSTLLSRGGIGGLLYDPYFSRSEDMLAFAWRDDAPDSASELWSYDRQSGRVSQIPLADQGARLIREPAYSHDGAKLYFFSSLDLRLGVTEFELVELDLATAQERRVTDLTFNTVRDLYVTSDCLVVDAFASHLSPSVSAEEQAARAVGEAGRSRALTAANVLCVPLDGGRERPVLGDDGGAFNLIAVGNDGGLVLVAPDPSGGAAITYWDGRRFTPTMRIEHDDRTIPISGLALDGSGRWALRVVGQENTGRREIRIQRDGGTTRQLDWDQLISAAARTEF